MQRLTAIAILTLTCACGGASDATKGTAGTNGADGQVGDVGAVGPAGEVGPAGAAGATGPQGEAGVDGVDGVDGTNGVDGADGADGAGGAGGGAQYRWVDAVGTVATDGPELLHFDADGYAWEIDQKSGDIVYLEFTPTRVYETVDCTGDAWINEEFPAPRVPFTIDPAPGFYVLADDQVVVPFTIESFEDTLGACFATGALPDSASYRIADMVYDSMILAPAGYVGPLHREQ